METAEDLVIYSAEDLTKIRAEVRERYPKITFPDPVMEPVWFGKQHHERIPGRRAIIDQNTGNVFAICTTAYKIIPYEDIIWTVEQAVKGITEYGEVIVCPRVLDNGGKMMVTVKLPDFQHKIKLGESVIPKVDIHTSYDLSWKIVGKVGAFMLKCLNGAGVWKHFRKYARRHLVSVEISHIRESLQEGLLLFGDQTEMWKGWTQFSLHEKSYLELWDAGLPFSTAERAKIEAIPEVNTKLTMLDALKQNELTLWSAYSVMTQYATHNIQSELRRVNIEPELAQVVEKFYDQRR